MNEIDTSKASRAFDAWAAREVMGWHRKSIPSFAIWCYYRTKETHPEKTKDWLERFPSEATGWWADNVPTERWVYETDVPASVGYRGLWAPTIDIAAAWEAVHCFLSNHAGYGFALRLDWHGPEVAGSGYAWASFVLHDPKFGAYARTVPLAICRAAYKVLVSPTSP